MKWASSICGPDGLNATSDDLSSAIGDCLYSLRTKLAASSVTGGEERARADIITVGEERARADQIDLLIGFVTPHFADLYADIPRMIAEQEPAFKGVFIGCSAAGLIGGGQEIEQQPCIAFTAAHLPNVSIKPFYLSDAMLPASTSSKEEYEQKIGVIDSDNPSFILLPDPFSFRLDEFLHGIDQHFPESVKLGGLASGAHAPGGNALFMNDRAFNSGLVGVALSGNIVVDTVVAQGCKPIGSPHVITRAQRHILFELDAEPAIMVLKRTIDGLSGFDLELAKEAIFLGLVMDESKDDYQAGDFLIRNILGIEQTTGALVIGEVLDKTLTVQFHIRDAATSADDLRFLLKEYKEQHVDNAQSEVRGALLFSCLGRGAQLYGRANHDSDCFRDYLGPLPIGGFFCNGEIGPVGRSTYIHGYTSSFGIFREKESRC